MTESWTDLIEREWPHRGVDGVVSCSKLDRLFACPASQHLEDLPNEDEVGMPAKIGTVLHYLLLERYPSKLPDGMPEEVEDLYWWCKKILDDQDGTVYANEIYHATDVLTGTADMTRISDSSMSTFYIRDLKTGRIPVYPDSKQLLGYAYLMAEKHGHRSKIYNVGIVQPLVWGNDVPVVEYTADEAAGFGEELRSKLKERTFGASSYCTFCRAKGTSQCEQTNSILGLFVK